MILLDEATKDWATDGIWKIAPAGLSWISEGAWVSIGEGVSIGDGGRIGDEVRIRKGVRIGDGGRIGDKSKDAVDLGWADGYRKCIAQIDGVAYIGAGCHWFTLADALTHWSNKADRELTMCLMKAAVHIASLRGWRHL